MTGNGFRFDTVASGDIDIHVATIGDPAAPMLLCLHGFPEYWAAWADVALQLARDHHVVMPDLRGFNFSSKPQDIRAYQIGELIADVAAVAAHFGKSRKFLLAGHDWGAALAYAYAFRHADQLQGLIIANGVHPWCFQKAIINDPVQRAASQYMNRLRLPEASKFMEKDGYARVLNMMTGFSRSDWMTAEKRTGYVDAWSQPGALNAMLNWYRASPVLVPRVDDDVTTAPLLDLPAATMSVTVPHLVIWGMEDEALRPSCLDGLERFAEDLRIEKVEHSGHWILHEQPEAVAAIIRSFSETL